MVEEETRRGAGGELGGVFCGVRPSTLHSPCISFIIQCIYSTVQTLNLSGNKVLISFVSHCLISLHMKKRFRSTSVQHGIVKVSFRAEKKLTST